LNPTAATDSQYDGRHQTVCRIVHIGIDYVCTEGGIEATKIGSIVTIDRYSDAIGNGRW
jgi:hypothetical protein